jgi:alpha-1,2-mannosyltransferase
MGRLIEALRSGDWLTRERVWVIPAVLLFASVAGFLFLLATVHDDVDRQGRPIGTDFSNVYAAGTYVREGKSDAPFDPPRQFAREQKLFGSATQFYGWHYPPFFLFIAGALAWLPYGAALAVWQAATLALYLLTIRAILISSSPSPEEKQRQGVFPPPSQRRPGTLARIASHFDLSAHAGTGNALWLLLALAFPAVLINVGHGQNGFLTAALLGAALIKLDRAPLLAGVLFGLLVYKPQFGLMIPVVLAASGRWRCFAAAAVTVGLLTLATILAFGPHVWQAFLESTHFTRVVALEQGNTGWYKIQSLFAWARMWGAPVPYAYALQGALVVALAAALIQLWRGNAPYPQKAAALCVAAILATPYTFDYDMVALAPAIAFLAADGLTRGFGPWEKTALAALWLAPLLARSVAHATLIPLGVPAMLTVFVLLLRRTRREHSPPAAFCRAFVPK